VPVFYNIVTDTVIRQWYQDGMATGMATKGRFYADDGELWDHDPAKLQSALTSMEDLFLRMGLSVNGAKTKSLTTLPTISTTTISAVAYKRRMEGVGDTYWACKQLRTICPICDMAMQMRSIRSHYHSQHPGVRIPTPDNPFLQQNPETDEYIITAYDKHAPIQCPIPSCRVEVKGGWYAIRRHFLFRHHDIKIHVAEEGMLPQCSECGFQCALPHATHQRSCMCTQG